jgi:hypothetical protein
MSVDIIRTWRTLVPGDHAEGEVFLVTEGSENNARDKNCHEHHRADTLAWVLNT